MLVRKDETFNSVNAGEVTASGFSAAQRGTPVAAAVAIGDNKTMPLKGTYTFDATIGAGYTVVVSNPFVTSTSSVSATDSAGTTVAAVAADGSFTLTLVNGTHVDGNVTVTVA